LGGIHSIVKSGGKNGGQRSQAGPKLWPGHLLVVVVVSLLRVVGHLLVVVGSLFRVVGHLLVVVGSLFRVVGHLLVSRPLVLLLTTGTVGWEG